MLVGKMLIDYFESYTHTTKINVQSYDEHTNRYEPEEFNILGKFILNNLVFAKSELKLTCPTKISNLLHVLWDTLDIFACGEYNAAD